MPARVSTLVNFFKEQKKHDRLILIVSLVVLIAIPLTVIATQTLRDERSKAAPLTPARAEIKVKLLVLIYNPIIENSASRRLNVVMGWNNPDQLTSQMLLDFPVFTHGNVKYEVVERIEKDEWPVHTNGQRFTDSQYVNSWRTTNLGPGDLNAIITTNDIERKVNEGKIDEVWVWGGPGLNWPESAMAGNGAYWINGGPIAGVNSKAFPLMFLNFEREEAEALESYGHRVEEIMKRTYSGWFPGTEANEWTRFAQLDYDLPGRGGIGNAHNAFNAEPGTDYNRTSTRTLPTSADDWYNFPNMTGAFTNKNCLAWGCSAYSYLKWWYDHMPHMTGVKNKILNNWWRYIVDVEQYKNNWEFEPGAEVDFSENAATTWSCTAVSSTCSVSDETSKVIAGNKAIRFITNGGANSVVRYPAANNANFNLTSKTHLTFRVWADNSTTFQNASPTIYLRNSSGSFFRYSPNDELLNAAIGGWKQLSVPLSGGGVWTRTSSGSVSLSDIDQIEIHSDTWGAGFTLYIDDLGFNNGVFSDTIAPKVQITSPANLSQINTTTPVNVSSLDNFTVFGTEMYIDGQLQATDSLSPYIFSINPAGLSLGSHALTVKAYDAVGNEATSTTVNFSTGKKPGDVNNDNVVNSADLAILISTWGSTTDLRADFNGDARITSGDLAILISSWGN